MIAKKSFGQHFLRHPEIAKRIADSLTRVEAVEYRVLEVGPGQGMLTQFLIENKYQVLAVEADKDMGVVLDKKLASRLSELSAEAGFQNSFRIVYDDFLRFRLESAFDSQPFCLIGNFPYNISSQIVIKMLEHRSLVPEMVGMFQLEMAERIIAPPGSKDYGVISVLTQAFYEGKKLFNVDRGSFSPPPNVQSAVIRLVRKEQDELACSEKLFKTVVKTAFNQRRKMLRNTLRPLFDKDPSVLEAVFFQKRPEQLSIAEFVGIVQTLEKIDGANPPV